MSKTVVADVSDQVLESGTKYSDRYVYSNYFVPLRLTFDDDVTPIVPFFVKQRLLEYVRYGGLNEDRLDAILNELKLGALWGKNRMREALALLERSEVAPPADGSNVRAGGREFHAAEAGDGERRRPGHSRPSGGGRGRVGRGRGSLEEIAHAIQDTDTLLLALEERLDDPGREVLNVASEQLERSADELIERGASTSGNGGSRAAAMAMVRPTVLEDQDVELVAGLLQSTIGYGFLDRTRISPIGFAIGEHIYALGLSPGEEVVLEQKTFTKRQSTFEEQTEQERQLELELSSTYSTELQEGFERTRSLNDTWGLNLSHTGSYSSPTVAALMYGTWNASHSIAWTKNVASASQETRRRSVKDSRSASAKVSAKYRALHKTLFRVTAEQGFETTSKRTIRNPNRTTPITLHYFKVLERLRLRQERYGVRLCWAPAVKDPGRKFHERIRDGRKRILDDAIAALPSPPDEPKPSSVSGDTTKVEKQTFFSEVREADQHNFVQGQNSNYDVDVDIDDGWTWNGNKSSVDIDWSASLREERTYSGYISGMPVFVDGKLRVRVHVDAGDRTGAQPIYFQVTVTCSKDVTLPANASQDPVYEAALDDWHRRLAEWESARDEALDQANEAADAFEQQMLAQLSPVNETVSQIIEQYFEPTVPGEDYEEWEIEYWQRLFDWERATVLDYPGWWSHESARDPLGDPSDFINASWAKLFLPVRVGMELDALRWIHGKTTRSLGQAIEDRFAEVISDLLEFRTDVLEAPEEIAEFDQPCQQIPDKFSCLAEWAELMPTDGTHIEVVLGATNAADDITTQEVEDEAALRAGTLDDGAKMAELVEKTETLMTDPATVEVSIGLSPPSPS